MIARLLIFVTFAIVLALITTLVATVAPIHGWAGWALLVIVSMVLGSFVGWHLGNYPQREWTRGKYRWRTDLRSMLPDWAGPPKGEDCGNHEWYNQDVTTEACYHCRVTRWKTKPSGRIWAFRR